MASTESRQDNIYFARLSEQGERYEDMINYMKKVAEVSINLIKTHGARVLTFTTGNYRVKIDRAMPTEKKYKSFVRLPNFDIHSTRWFCKDY